MATEQQDEQDKIDLKLLAEQVNRFSDLKKKEYPEYARLLDQILTAACSDFGVTGIVGSRVKEIPSFTEKCIRKRLKYDDPVNQLTDLCGARVIVQTRRDVQRISNFVSRFFRIDEANSLDLGESLRPSEFGYRSVHFVVQLDQKLSQQGGSPTASAIPIPDDLLPRDDHPFKAEIQIRTIAQHAWADIGHDRIYKSKFDVPRQLRRQSARVAALLEDADEAFERLVQGVDAYRLQYDAYMSREERQQEIAVQQTLLLQESKDEKIVRELARLFLTLDDCQGAIDALDSFEGELTPALKTLLGYALCTAQEDGTAEHSRGERLLEEAADARPPNHDAIMHLADVNDRRSEARWKRKARQLYERAFRIDPSHPRALGGYVETKARDERSLDLVSLMRPMLEAAVEKCRDHAEVGVHLPDALYRRGEFLLFLGQPDKPYDALTEYTRAIAHTTRASDIESAVVSLERVSDLRHPHASIELARRLLLLAKSCKFDHGTLDDRLRGAETRGYSRLDKHGPVVIVAGGCDPHRSADMDTYAELLHAAFDDFCGVIISGGTEQGVSGLVGEIGAKHDGILTIGYLPSALDADATIDRRYKELRTNIGDKFSALQPLQNWIDLLSNGVSPHNVCVLGINGGDIAGFEYRLARALGAKVGLLRESGRVVGTLSREAEEFDGIPGIAFLPHDVITIKTFIEQDRESLFESDEQRIAVARAIHDHYRGIQREKSLKTTTLHPWDDLKEEFQHSNIAQADHIPRKLEAVGLEAVPVSDREIELFDMEPYVEELARREHARWLVERAPNGWRHGEVRDDVKKLRPDLVSWEKLSEESRNDNRDIVRAIPQLLKSVGLEIRKKSPASST